MNFVLPNGEFMKNRDLWKIGIMTMTTLLLCGLAIPTAAQSAAITRIAPEQGFTIPAKVSTSIVLKTSVDAACDLHPEGVNDKRLRFYGNSDGYVKLHMTAKQETEDGMRFQLDCTDVKGAITRYPLHLRAASSPTHDMPAPQSVMPVPKGSKIVPALTDAEARQLSNGELISRGYPERPDANTSPDRYALWLREVSRPITVVPSHQVSRSEINQQAVQAGPTYPSFATSYNWSGYVSTASAKTYDGVYGTWVLPGVYNPDNSTNSSFWVGLDGYGLTDLVQAGTSSDCWDWWIFSGCDYSAWTEVLPNQQTSQGVDLSPNQEDLMAVEVWIAVPDVFAPSGFTPPVPDGDYAIFAITDLTQNQQTIVNTNLNGTYFNGSEAEWIMERPGIGGAARMLLLGSV